MARPQEKLDFMQEPPLPTLNLNPERIGKNFYPVYRAPFAVQAISGAMRLRISVGACGVLLAQSGTLRCERDGTAIEGPCLMAASGSWISSAQSVGWIGA